MICALHVGGNIIISYKRINIQLHICVYYVKSEKCTVPGSVRMVEGTIAMSEVGQGWGRDLARDTS